VHYHWVDYPVEWERITCDLQLGKNFYPTLFERWSKYSFLPCSTLRQGATHVSNVNARCMTLLVKIICL
jgi:hypothetical protein